jgi:small subunit ribosomal protein S18
MDDYRERDRGGDEGGQSGERRYFARPKICQFCADKNLKMDYKNAEQLKRYVTEDGKIRPRRQTGTCARHQRELAGVIKRARHIAILPYVGGGRED